MANVVLDLTPEVAFENRTCLLTDILVDQVFQERDWDIESQYVNWFYGHVNERFRYMHANNPEWRRWLENKRAQIDPRDQCKVWIRHWLTAYVIDPETYQRNHA